VRAEPTSPPAEQVLTIPDDEDRVAGPPFANGTVTMKSLAMLLGLIALAWVGPASAHGCHHAWQLDRGQGWHSHGAHCEARKGLGVSQRSRARARRA